MSSAASEAITSAVKHLSAFDFQALLDCGHGKLFGPGNARLPLPPMLMFDRITHISDKGGANDKGQIVAELDVKPDLWFFKCHKRNGDACECGFVRHLSSAPAGFALKDVTTRAERRGPPRHWVTDLTRLPFTETARKSA
jgi:hypothetical protein